MKHSLDKAWSLDGDWTESEDQSTASVPGDLEYDPESGIRLKLKGVLDTQAPDLTKQPSYPRLFGRAPDVGDVTLIDAFTSGRSTGTVDRSDLVATTAVLGLHLPSAATPTFDSASVSLGHVEEWLGWRPIEMDCESGNLSLTTRPPEPLKATVQSLGCDVAIEPEFGSDNEGWNRMGLVHTAMMRVTPGGSRTSELQWYLGALAGLRDLITLFTGGPSWFRTIKVEQGADWAGQYLGLESPSFASDSRPTT